MHGPQEILNHIIQFEVEILPLKDIFRARLVSGFFAEEITTLLFKSPLLEDEFFGCRGYEHSWRSAHRSRLFPHRLKLRYLRLKLEQHAQNPCVFSIWTHKMLEGNEQKDLLIGKLLHAVALGKYNAADLLSTEHVGVFTDQQGYIQQLSLGAGWEPLETTLYILMACSVIWRGDANELEGLIWQGADLELYSYRFSLLPMDVAAKMANADVVRVLFRHPWSCPRNFWFAHNYTDVLSVTAGSSNKVGMDAWITAIRECSSTGVRYRLDAAVRSVARIGNIEMVQFILDRCDRDQQELRWLLDRGGFDPSVPTKERPAYPIPVAVHCCKPETQRPVIVKMLLEHGADPNRIYPRATRTPLQKAMHLNDRETATLLVKYGADTNPPSLCPASKSHRRAPILLLAVRQRTTH